MESTGVLSSGFIVLLTHKTMLGMVAFAIQFMTLIYAGLLPLYAILFPILLITAVMWYGGGEQIE